MSRGSVTVHGDKLGRDWFGKRLDFQPPQLAMMVTQNTLQFSKEKEQQRAIMRHLASLVLSKARGLLVLTCGFYFAVSI